MDIYLQKLHLVYKISSNFSNDFYIGRKTVKKLSWFNNYWSSSKKFKKFVLDNGIQNFTKEILFQFDNEQEQVEKENYFNLVLYKNDPNCWSRGTFTGLICEALRESNQERVENGTHNFLGEEHNKKRVAEGTHNFLGGEIQRKSAQERVAEGTHNFLNGEMTSEHNRKRVENGTHPFLGGEIQRKSNRKRVENGTHHLLGGEISKKNAKERVADGTHNFLGKGREDHPGKKNKGSLWVCNSEGAAYIRPNQLDEYLSRGYKKGRKF